jgi:hypothetical protein
MNMTLQRRKRLSLNAALAQDLVRLPERRKRLLTKRGETLKVVLRTKMLLTKRSKTLKVVLLTKRRKTLNVKERPTKRKRTLQVTVYLIGMKAYRKVKLHPTGSHPSSMDLPTFSC